jgi:hypothetical protein
LSFTDFATRNNWENTYEGSQGWNTFITSWGNGLTWDLKTSFAWNLNDQTSDVAPYETESIHFNPFIDLYGYWIGEWWAENEDVWWLQLSFNISPFEVHLIDIDISSDKRPDAAPFNLCTNIGFNQSPPFHFEANIAWGWNNCEWGFFENLVHGKS